MSYRFISIVENAYERTFNEKLSFGEVLNKYAITGQSCETVSTNLKRILNIEEEFIRNTFRYAVKRTIAAGKTKFKIAAKTKNNPYRKSGTANTEFAHKPKHIICKMTGIVFCHRCGTSYGENLDYSMTNGKERLYLELVICKECGATNSCSAHFYSNFHRNMISVSLEETKIAGIFKEVHEIISDKTLANQD